MFAATDILARVTLDACRVAGCRVPDDVLVLGVDNDVTLCEMSTPSTGTTIAEEVMRLRIEHAKRLLATTDDSQERIASACGFYNASHLGAVFRRRCGAPPSSFR